MNADIARRRCDRGPIDKNELAKWYKARDTFLGWNFCRQDVNLGLRLARECTHEDAKWLAGLFPKDVPLSKEEAKRVFLAQGEDARALCFAGRVSLYDETLFLRSAHHGYPQAQVMASIWASDKAEKWDWIVKAFAQGERTAIALMADYLWKGDVCEKNEQQSLLLFREAAEMDHVLSQHFLGERGFGENQPERYKWWGKAAANGNSNSVELLAVMAVSQMELRANGGGIGGVVFALGAACEGHFNARSGTLFGKDLNGLEVDAVRQVLELYDSWCANARTAILFWLWITKKNPAMRDIATLIAKSLWDDRSAWSNT